MKELIWIARFWPISLCNVVYKIVTMVIGNRLKLMLDAIISLNQIPGRLIMSTILVGFECIHTNKNKKKGKKGNIALKLDMSKGYDNVE